MSSPHVHVLRSPAGRIALAMLLLSCNAGFVAGQALFGPLETTFTTGSAWVEEWYVEDIEPDGQLELIYTHVDADLWGCAPDEDYHFYSIAFDPFGVPGPRAFLLGFRTGHGRSAFGDLNNDGVNDFVVNAAIYRKNRRFVFMKRFSGYERIGISIKPTPDDDMAIADFDNDGLGDVLVSSPGYIFVHYNLSMDTFAPPEYLNPSFGFTYTLLRDLDNDGYTDVVGMRPVGRVAWFRNLSGAGFDPMIELVTDSCTGFLLADMDGDGFEDIVTANDALDIIRWYPNGGSAGFGAAIVLATDADGPDGIKAADLNQDGAMDLVCGGKEDGILRWYQNLGDGTSFAGGDTLHDFLIPTSLSSFKVDAGDMDGDGWPDVLANYNTADVVWFKNLMGECPAPTGTISTIYAADSVELSWTPVPEAERYRFQAMPVAGGPLKNRFVTNSFVRTNSTLPLTTYQWRVKSECFASRSEWTPVQSFTTPSAKTNNNPGHTADMDLSIQPNPAPDRSLLRWSSEYNIDEVLVYNAQGQVVGQYRVSESSSLELSTDQWPSGVYSVLGKSASATHSIELVVP